MRLASFAFSYWWSHWTSFKLWSGFDVSRYKNLSRLLLYQVNWACPEESPRTLKCIFTQESKILKCINTSSNTSVENQIATCCTVESQWLQWHARSSSPHKKHTLVYTWSVATWWSAPYIDDHIWLTGLAKYWDWVLDQHGVSRSSFLALTCSSIWCRHHSLYILALVKLAMDHSHLPSAKSVAQLHSSHTHWQCHELQK